MEKDYLKNFGMFIPKYVIHFHSNCVVINATGEEFKHFKKWVSKELIQLQAGEEKLDIWINKPNDLGRTTKDLQKWFNHWKNPPQYGYSVTSFNIKKP